MCVLVPQLCPTIIPWTIASQTPLSKGYSKQEYWSGLPFPSPGDLPDPGIKPRFPLLQADSLLSEPLNSSLPRLLCPWDFPGKSTGVGCHFLLQNTV